MKDLNETDHQTPKNNTIIRIQELYSVYLAGKHIFTNENHQAVRYLGIWIDPKGTKNYQKQLIWEKVLKVTNLIKCKRIMEKIVRYIINSVLLPQIEYLTTDYIFDKRFINKVDQKIRASFRTKEPLSWVFPNAAINGHIGYNVFSFKDRLLIKTVSELMVRLNSIYIDGTTTKIRLQSIQNKL